MPAHRKRPIPPARMVELLAQAKREALALQGDVTPADFDQAWTAAWEQMVRERAWPHNSVERRQWRAAMIATKSELRAAFLGRDTMFARFVAGLNEASARWNFVLAPEDIPKAVLGAIENGYRIASDEQAEEEEGMAA